MTERLLATSTKICIERLIPWFFLSKPLHHCNLTQTSYTWQQKQKLPRPSLGSLQSWPPERHPFSGWHDSVGELLHDSLRGCRLPRPPSYCPHHIEHPFAFIGNLEWSRLSTKLNSKASGWIPHRQSCLPENGPLLPFVGRVVRVAFTHKKKIHSHS